MSETLPEIEKVFMAFADKTRLRLLYLMRQGEVSVNYLCESLETSQPKVSRHLAYLRSMDMVHTRRDGKWIFYSLNVPESRLGSQLLRDMLEWVGNSDELRGTARGARILPARPTHIDEPVTELEYTYARTNISRDQDNELEVYLL